MKFLLLLLSSMTMDTEALSILVPTGGAVIGMRSVSHTTKGSDTWSSAGGTVLEGCGTLRRWGLAGGSELVGASLAVFIPWPYFLYVHCFLVADAT